MSKRAFSLPAWYGPPRWLKPAALNLVVLTLSAVVASAQSGGGYDLSWSTVDTGSGSSAGGSYGLKGTAGQPDPSTSTGGPYTVQGGFWGVLQIACLTQFSDVPQANAFHSFVRCLVCREIISGYADGTFRPNNQVTRGQLSKIVANTAGFSEPHPGQSFEDVPVSHPFHVFIERLAGRGIISGYNCGGIGEPCVPPGNRPYFRPGNNVTRGQTSKITTIARSLPAPPAGQQTFEDVPATGTFWEWIEALAATGAISGYSCGGPGEPCMPPGNRPYFRPNNDVTRGQSAKIVANAFLPSCPTR
jgi:hypothetical protein